ncbi:SMR family transporter [Entomomonas sp. E2T0]|uniref:SMR family transporter n=1 Tax=Entomomonas sp. E2T0 TaxID=2930213 RepID=UPI0022281843|nr:SMR family transporter [Entomomonas sp. E2T0]UYZ83995.1 SMR family transporter [Entomomonas sp. E2T0]
MRSWIYLLVAIGCEIIGLVAMKLASTNYPMLGHLVMYIMIGGSFYLLSLAVRKIPLGVAYALWEGIGIVLITIISVALFNEYLNAYKILGLGLLVSGILLIKLGVHSPKEVKQYDSSEAI